MLAKNNLNFTFGKELKYSAKFRKYRFRLGNRIVENGVAKGISCRVISEKLFKRRKSTDMSILSQGSVKTGLLTANAKVLCKLLSMNELFG